MPIQNWIDEIAKRWEMDDGAGGTVKSYRSHEFPESLAQFPCAITYVRSWQPVAGLGVASPMKALYRGVTELHVVPNTAKQNLPKCNRYFGLIRNAVVAHLQLGGLVDDFRFASDREAILGPVELKYGNEDGHLGLVINWEVKVDESAEAGYSPAL
jgi:hypothetical protein